MAGGEKHDEGDGPGLWQLGGRILLLGLLIVAGLFLAQQWGAGDRRERESFALVSGNIRLSDLQDPVEILRDSRGIPHVFAERELEGFFGLGFVHAQDRLAQMAWIRRKAYGRSAEILGESALASDRLARLLEIASASERAAKALPKETQAVLEAYSAGVNARIARVREGLMSPPHRLMGGLEGLTSWKPADTVAVVKLLSWCMGGTLETTLVLDDLIQRLDSVPARPFFPGGASVDFGVAPDVPRHAMPETERSRAIREELLGTTRALCRGIGLPSGGAFVLDGSKTGSGAPMIVADWHFEPAVPGLLHESQLFAGETQVAGVTVPGTPLYWAGRSRNFAWAGVPASAPVSDLFVETLREDRGAYQNGKLWVPIETRTEKLGWRDARGQVATMDFEVRSTRHGPLIESLWDPDGSMRRAEAENDPRRAARALAWTGARAGDGITSVLGLMRAQDAEGISGLLAEHHEPVLAFAYADRKGRGGVQVAGWRADRPLPTGLVPVQGRLRSFDWKDRLSLARLPHVELDARKQPWALALDQSWSSRAGLDQTEWLWRPGDRARRLERTLTERLGEGRIDLRGAAELFLDDRAERAPRVAAAIVGMARQQGPLPVEAQEIATLLERWDGTMRSESAGAAAYQLVLEHLLGALLREPFGEALFARYVAAPHVEPQSAIERLLLRSAKLRRDGGWTDQARVGQAARDSLRSAWVSLNHRLGPTRDRWSWGGLHRLQFIAFATEGHSSPRELRSLAVGGSGQTLDFARHRLGVSFRVERAALYRVAMDLGSPDRILSVMAPGQSEHPGHPHYLDGVSRWGASRISLLPTSRLAIEEEEVERLVLEPAP